MTDYPEIIHILIAGVLVEIRFLPSENPLLRRYLIKGFYLYFGDFIIENEKNKKPQYKIIFEDFKKLTTIKQQQNGEKQYYLYLYSEKKNVLKTNYHISISQFGFLLRELMQKILVSKKGFQIHCSSIVAGEKVFVFVGKSGAGKSTASGMLSSKYMLFSDDSLAIRKVGTYFHAFQTMEYEKKRTQKYPKGYILGTIFLLQKSDSYKIEDIKLDSKTLQSILSEVWLNEDESINRQIKTCLSILSPQHIKLFKFGLNKRKVVGMFDTYIS